jgi:uncharacterized protein (DUF2235 family)
MPKNIVICSDGTGNTAIKGRGTNVFKLYEAVDTESHKTDLTKDAQIAFYDDGVGTERLKPLAIFAGVFGFGLSRNVKQLYADLARTYQSGDRIYLFGFSRGAFTVRTLAGLITTCGIVDRTLCESDDDLRAAVAEAYETYRLRYQRPAQRYVRDVAGRPRRDVAPRVGRFWGRRRPWDVSIELVGVWDTVDAVGFPVTWLVRLWNAVVYPFTFPDRTLHPRVKRGCHALAIDDERATFHPLLWDERPETSDRIQQVWFAGVHANVGGGYPKQGMSLVSLVWMMEEARAAGLRFVDLDWQLYHEHQNVDDFLYDSRAGLALYYEYKPRDIARMCTEQRIEPKLHASAVERIAQGPGGYAPGNIPSTARMVGPGDPTLPLGQVMHAMQAALGRDSSLLDRVRRLVRVRKWSQHAIMVASAIFVGLTLIDGSRGATFESWLDLLSLHGLASLVGSFLGSAVRGGRWRDLTCVATILIAYVIGWRAAKRMKRVFSEFWYQVIPRIR